MVVGMMLCVLSLQADTSGRLAFYCLTGHVIKELPIKGVVANGPACRDEPQCRSFNVWPGNSGGADLPYNDVTREGEADENDIETDISYYFFN